MEEVAQEERVCYCGALRKVVDPWRVREEGDPWERITLRCTGSETHDYTLHRGVRLGALNAG